MADERIRELERAWLASSSWDDWSAWAFATRRSEDRDPARLLRALRRLSVLSARVLSLHRRHGREEPEDRAARAQAAHERTSAELPRFFREVRRLSRRVMTPAEDGSRHALAAARRLALGEFANQLAPAAAVFIRGGRLTEEQAEQITRALREGTLVRHRVMALETVRDQVRADRDASVSLLCPTCGHALHPSTRCAECWSNTYLCADGTGELRCAAECGSVETTGPEYPTISLLRGFLLEAGWRQRTVREGLGLECSLCVSRNRRARGGRGGRRARRRS